MGVRPGDPAERDDRIKPSEPAERLRSDFDLLEAVRRGEPSAFEELVRRHERRIYRVAFRFFQRRVDAEDIVQEVFVRAYREFVRFRGGAQVGTWLYRIAVNACLDRKRYRRTRPEVPLELALGEVAGAPDPFARAASREFADRVVAAMEDLPPRQRAILVLRIYEELSLQEIADIVESPLGTVKANYHHALVKVRRALQDLIERRPGERDLP